MRSPPHARPRRGLALVLLLIAPATGGCPTPPTTGAPQRDAGAEGDGAAAGDTRATDAAPTTDAAPLDADTDTGAGPPADAADAAPSPPADAADARLVDTASADVAGGLADAEATGDGGGSSADGSDAGCVEGAPCELASPPPPCAEGRCNALGRCAPALIPGCCLDDADCGWLQPLDPCEARRCVERECQLIRRPACCATNAECDDGVACTQDACGPDTGLCRRCPQGCPCDAVPLLYEGFDDQSLAAAGFTVEDGQWGDAVTWSRSTARAVRPPGAAYLGDPTCHTYYNGAVDAGCAPVDPFAQDATRVSVTLSTPTMSLPADGPGFLATFWIWAEVEPFVAGGPDEPDVLRVSVAPAGAEPAWEVASSLDVGKDTAGGWQLMAVDLSPWRGRAVRLRFAFDSLDGQANGFEGIYLDELRVFEACAAGGCCDSDADCLGGDPGACTLARCVALTSGAGRFCAEVPVAPGAPCAPCESGGDCEDGDPCTTDTCVDGGCRHEAYCCLARTALVASFDDDLDGWESSPHDPTDAGWAVGTTRAWDGPGAARFGLAGADHYDTGAPVAGTLTSPPVTVPSPPPSGAGAEVAFALWLSTEWDAAPYDNPAGLDRLALTALSAAGAVEIWSSDEIGGTTAGQWRPISARLDPWIGQEIQLRFSFESVDADDNAHSGPWIDALEVRTACP